MEYHVARALALLNMLGVKPQYSDDENPLARRARLDR